MKHCSDFQYDLKLGNKGENLIAKVLMLEGSKIEVKTDFHAIKGNATGNVFIEYESRGKLSGISTSRADWWCFILSNEQVILIHADKLKALCKRKGLKRVNGGDNNTSRGILLPIKLLLTD
jgi:hypothetical protein